MKNAQAGYCKQTGSEKKAKAFRYESKAVMERVEVSVLSTYPVKLFLRDEELFDSDYLSVSLCSLVRRKAPSAIQ